MHYAVHVYSAYMYMYIGAGVSWGIQYSSLHLPIVQTKAQTNTHHSAAHHRAAHHTATHYYTRHLSRYARYSSPTHYLSHTNCSGHFALPPYSLPPLQILVITNILSVAMFQTQYVHLSILFTTSSRTAAVSAPPPVRHPHLTASQCGAIEVHKQTPNV